MVAKTNVFSFFGLSRIFLFIHLFLFSTATAATFRLSDGGGGLHSHQSALGQTLQQAFAGEKPVGLYADVTGGATGIRTLFYEAMRVGGRFDMGYGSELDDTGYRYWTSLGISQEKILESMHNPELYYKSADEVPRHLMSADASTTMARALFGCRRENGEGSKISYELSLDVPFDTYSTLVLSNTLAATIPLSSNTTLESALGSAYAGRGIGTLMGLHHQHFPSWLAEYTTGLAGMLSPASKISRAGLYTSFTLGCWYRKNGFFGGLGFHGTELTCRSQPLCVPMVRQVKTNEKEKRMRVSIDAQPVDKMSDFGAFVCAGYQGPSFKIMLQVTAHDEFIAKEPVASLTGSFTF